LLKKLDWIFLDNTNPMHVLIRNSASIDNKIDTIMVNELSKITKVRYSPQNNYLIHVIFTIGLSGKNKNPLTVTKP
jgi:hypothetical protein